MMRSTLLLLLLALLPACRTRSVRGQAPEPASARSHALADVSSAQDEASLREAMHRRAGLLEEAVAAFEVGAFDETREHAQRVLDEEPDNVKAAELQAAARTAETVDGTSPEVLVRHRARFREWMDDFLSDQDERTQVMKWPSRSFWNQVVAVRAAQQRG